LKRAKKKREGGGKDYPTPIEENWGLGKYSKKQVSNLKDWRKGTQISQAEYKSNRGEGGGDETG